MKFKVTVQHENFEHKGKTHANIISLGVMFEAEDDLYALKQAQAFYADEHSPHLLMVEPVHNA
jgi:hypothetical protein